MYPTAKLGLIIPVLQVLACSICLQVRNLRTDILNLLKRRLTVHLAVLNVLLKLTLLHFKLLCRKGSRTVVSTRLLGLRKPELLTPLVCRNNVLRILVALGGNLLVQVRKRVCGLNIAGKLRLCNGLLDLGKRLGLRGGVAVQCILVALPALIWLDSVSPLVSKPFAARFSAFEPPGLMLCIYAFSAAALLASVCFITSYF